MNTIKLVIKEALKVYKSERQIALAIGISPQQLSNYKMGDYSPTIATLQGWIKKLNMEMSLEFQLQPSAWQSIAAMECYIEYRDASNHYTVTKKFFDSYESATIWGKKEFEVFHPDMVHYI